MTEAVPARTALANGQRYVSCIVLSSMLELTASMVVPLTTLGFLCVSCSFPGKENHISSFPMDLCTQPPTDIMLGASLHPRALNTNNSLFHQHTRQICIRTKTLPVPAAIWRPAKRTNHGAQCNMRALAAELSAHVCSSLPIKLAVPRCCCCQLGRKHRGIDGLADGEGPVLQAEAGEI
jgi:hypothetical protein